MEKKIKEKISELRMCPFGARIVIGVSGGADSVALLHVLNRWKEEFCWQLEVVHIHHGLRGVEADRDMQFVQTLCEQWGVTCHAICFDVKKESSKRGLGWEETGRLLRYESFAKIAKEDLIAVAHNEDDQGETMLMRLCRGTSLVGLGGIRPVRGNIVRPLLYCSRAEIEEYCKRENLSYCTDATNLETIYTRNKIRLQVMPLLETLYPKAKRQIAKTAQIVLEENGYIEEQVELAFSHVELERVNDKIVLDIQRLKKYHIAIQRRIFLKAISQIGFVKNISFIHLEDIGRLLEKEGKKEIHLPEEIVVEKSYNSLIFQRGSTRLRNFDYELKLQEEIFITEGNFYIILQVTQREFHKNFVEDYTKVFDYDKIKNSVFCRNRRSGDYLAIGNGQKKLKDFFIDEKIPKEQRDEMPLIACESEILWVIGKRVSRKFQPTEHTKTFLTIQIRRI